MSGDFVQPGQGHRTVLPMPPSDVPGAQVIYQPFVASDTAVGQALRRAVERRAEAIANPQGEPPDFIQVLLEELRA